MTTRRVRTRALAAGLAALALSGCGDSRAGHPPPLNRVPLVPGARVYTSATRCDPGANAYCALELVMVDARYRVSHDFFMAEMRLLHSRHWSVDFADTAAERSAESPGHRLRVVLAPGEQDLRAIDQNYIKRSRRVALALSRLLFEGTPSLSLLLEAGSS